MHALDNPIWTALTTKQAQLAHSSALARRFPPEMTLLGALAANTPMAFDSLAQLIQRDTVTLYFPARGSYPWAGKWCAPWSYSKWRRRRKRRRPPLGP